MFDRGIFALIALFSFEAFAGGVTSGGGFVYSDNINPWFIQNTETVHYCIQIDEENFGVDLNMARQTVRVSLAKWQKVFKDADTNTYLPDQLEPYSEVLIATQNFIESECNDKIDLRFQFGILSKEQMKKFSIDPAITIAQAVRTDYDEEVLRGKGFIYIAPAKGSLRPSEAKMAENPWQFCNGCMLERAVKHELGHVFGLGHFGGHLALMGSQHVEQITNDDFQKYMRPEDLKLYLQNWESSDVFAIEKAPYEFSYCRHNPGQLFHKDFDTDPRAECIRFSIVDKKLNVYDAIQPGDDWRLVGSMDVYRDGNPGQDAVRVKLPKKQKVFTKIPNRVSDLNTIAGPIRNTGYSFDGEYRSASGRVSRRFFIEVENNDDEARLVMSIYFATNGEVKRIGF